MSFVRPEASAKLARWREALIGLACLALGAWWAFHLGGLMTWIGGAVMLGGAALIAIGVQRGRFRTGGGGPGVVQIDEGQITYFGPLTGGAVDLADLVRLEYDPAGHPAHWRLSQPGQPPLSIPVTAEGADALFDAFSALPGLRTERMLAAMKSPPPHSVVIWQGTANRLH
jgi:hypothetical protein